MLKEMKALADALETIKTADIKSELYAKIGDAQAAMIQAQSAAMALHQDSAALLMRVSELEKQIAEVEEWESEKENYEAKLFDPQVLTYVPKEGKNTMGVDHRLCANCFTNKRKSILQPTANLSARRRVWACHSCQWAAPMGGQAPAREVKVIR